MKIKIIFFAELREIFGSHRHLEIAEGQKVSHVSDLLAEESARFLEKQKSLRYAVNEDFVAPERTLRDKDCLAILMPMSGG